MVLASVLPSTSGLLSDFGAVGVGLILFAETGLLIGFFLPGDSLLFLAGAYTAGAAMPGRPHLNLALLILFAAVGAILGAQTGYLIGSRAGPALFDRDDSRFFKREYVAKTHTYFERFGPRTVVLARFIPIVRTFANPAAGMGTMNLGAFALFNVIGGLLWTVGVTLLGHALGSAINIDHYIIPITVVIVALSFIPVLLELRRGRRGRAGSPRVR